MLQTSRLRVPPLNSPPSYMTNFHTQTTSHTALEISSGCHFQIIFHFEYFISLRGFVNRRILHGYVVMVYNGKKESKTAKTTKVEQGVGLHIEMMTSNGWCAGGGVKNCRNECSVYGGRWTMTSIKTFLEIITEGSVTTETGSLFPCRGPL